MDVLMLSDTAIHEQVFAVPKTSCPPRPLRAVLSEPQMAEQLVEVLTVVSFSSQFFEQIIDIPVQGGGVSGYGGLQRFRTVFRSAVC